MLCPISAHGMATGKSPTEKTDSSSNIMLSMHIADYGPGTHLGTWGCMDVRLDVWTSVWTYDVWTFHVWTSYILRLDTRAAAPATCQKPARAEPASQQKGRCEPECFLRPSGATPYTQTNNKPPYIYICFFIVSPNSVSFGVLTIQVRAYWM